MAVLYTPHFVQFLDDNGDPLSGGLLYTYAAGTTTPKATYTTAAGDVENSNPVVLDSYGRAVIFITGSYKFVLKDSNEVTIETTDNVTAFNASSEATEGYFESFSGDSIETDFTLSENLGNDEKALTIFAELEATTNGTFASDTGWTKGTGWTIGSGVAIATGGISTALEQTAGIPLVEGKTYSCTYTITRSAGSVTISLGGTNGTARSASGTYTDNIVCGSSQTIAFTGASFTGTIDNVSIKEIGGTKYIPPTKYTLSGTTLSFSTPIATGTGNINVTAPYSLINAAGAAQVAADTAIAAQAAAEAAQAAAESSETNAASSETNAAASAASVTGLDTTSTTSLLIEVASKSFTVDSGKGFVAGMWVLATSDADPANYMHGQVTSYSSTTLIVDVDNIGGSGTYADWTIRVSGTRGATGATGPTGPAGGDTLKVSATDTTADYLNSKISVSSPLTITKQDSGADEWLKVSAPVASQAEAEAGTSNTKFMTPLATAYAISALGGGAWVPISTQTAASDASIDFTSGIDGTYDTYAIYYTSVIPSVDGENLYFRLGNGGAFDSGASDYGYTIEGKNTSGDAGGAQAATSQIVLSSNGVGSGTGESISGVVFLHAPSSASNTLVTGSCVHLTAAGLLTQVMNGGQRIEAAAHDRAQFLFSSGNIASGTFSIYGRKGA